jgi:hypothetical protein
VSFVNSINTIKGGTHANYVADAVAACVLRSAAAPVGMDARARLRALMRLRFALLRSAQQAAGAHPEEEQGGGREAVPGEEPPVGVCQRPHRKPSLRLSGALACRFASAAGDANRHACVR